MGSVEDRARELENREAVTKAMGGSERLRRQHESGKLTAGERLGLLFDPGSFCEVDTFVQHRRRRLGGERDAR